MCIATPDDRHFAAARAALSAGKHVLIEKPSVLTLAELDELERLAREQRRAGQGGLSQAARSRSQEAAHAGGGRRARACEQRLLYVARAEEHFRRAVRRMDRGSQPRHIRGGALHQADRFHIRRTTLKRACTGQRGLVGPADGPTWDSTQLRLIYAYDDGREAAFDIHTSWVTPDNFPGYVEQEVQFRFDNGVWNAHSRKRGVECTVEGRRRCAQDHDQQPLQRHIPRTVAGARSAATASKCWSDSCAKSRRSSLAGRPVDASPAAAARSLAYNDSSADRQTVAAVQAMEAILARHAAGEPNCVVEVDHPAGGLVLLRPG